MKIERIEFKNVFAYGEKLNVIEYTSEGKLVLLKGKSGAGKSTIMSLPVLLLYGKTDKIPKNAVANRINKNGFIKGVITNNGHQYTIERTFNPTSLKIFKDGQDIENYGIKDAQEYIDTEITDIPAQVFNNILSVSMRRFKSFLSMTPYDRKTIVDNIFSLDIVNKVYEKIKRDSNSLGNSINADNSTLYSLNNNLQNAMAELKKLSENIRSEEDRIKIEENNKKIIELNEELKKYNEAYIKVSSKSTELTQCIASLQQDIFNTDSVISQIRQKINLFNSHKCPTCGASFDTEQYDSVRQKLNELLNQKDEYKKAQDTKIVQLRAGNQKCQEIISQINSQINNVKITITKIISDNRNIENSINSNSEYQSINNIIDNISEQINSINENLKNNSAKMEDLQKLLSIFSTEGIKQTIIANYLPMFNKEIKKNLQLLSFPYQLQFDAKFEPTLTDLNNSIAVDSLSDGEKCRSDIIVLCALLKVLKFKFPSINLFYLDEVLSTLDPENIQKVLSFLKQLAKDIKINVFVVTHVDVPDETFDEQLMIVKNNGFSEIQANE